MDVGPQAEQGPLSVDLIDPAPNAVLTASPGSLLLEFNRPIFPDTLDNGCRGLPDRRRRQPDLVHEP